MSTRPKSHNDSRLVLIPPSHQRPQRMSLNAAPATLLFDPFTPASGPLENDVCRNLGCAFRPRTEDATLEISRRHVLHQIRNSSGKRAPACLGVCTTAVHCSPPGSRPQWRRGLRDKAFLLPPVLSIFCTLPLCPSILATALQSDHFSIHAEQSEEQVYCAVRRAGLYPVASDASTDRGSNTNKHPSLLLALAKSRGWRESLSARCRGEGGVSTAGGVAAL